MKPFVSIQELPEKELVPGIFARFIHMEKSTVGHIRLLEGSLLPEHHHPHEQVTNVIAGSLEMTVNGKTMICGPGQSVRIPSDTPHSARAVTDCFVIDVFAPVREDYR